MKIVHKTCNLCEATCGLLIEVEENRVRSIRADKDDPFSRGHICPKAFMLEEVQVDPDRLKFPVRRTRSGDHERISWEEALEETAERLARIQRRHGADAIASFAGNPSGHNYGTSIYMQALFAAMGTKNRYSAASVDQNPKHAACMYLFGNLASFPVPDVDRTQYLLMLGANPIASNGSIMTAPDIRGRLRAIQQRGGKIVLVDPRRTETAKVVDEHIFLRPGEDSLLLAALVHVVLEEKIGRAGPATPLTTGVERLAERLRPFAPESVAGALGIDAATIRRLAREFAAAPSAACYGRLGTCLQEFGTLASWLVDVLNIVTGNLDRPGGAMFTTPAADIVGFAKWSGLTGHIGKWKSRVRGAPEMNDEFPAACLAEEILTPGPGQIRGLMTLAGNPVLSSPNGGQLDRALASLEFMAAFDFYVNETTRHAHLILPPTWSLEHDNYELVFHLVSVRNTTKYSPRVLEPEPGTREDWEILADLTLRLAEKRSGPLGRAAFRTMRRAGLFPGPRTVLDWFIRLGPHGDRFLPWSRGLNLKKIEAQPKGIDLGPLVPSLARVLQTKSGRIELDHPVIAGELEALAARLRAAPAAGAPANGNGNGNGNGPLTLIGRRDLRTNNSWGHNSPTLVKGRPRCTLLMNPGDAARLGLASGEDVRVKSRVGEVVAPLVVSDEMMPGVVSLPHGWGHARPGVKLRVAATQPGVSVNDLTDDLLLERVTGNAVVNQVPVTVEAAARPARVAV